jgi:hypothetical protein
LLIEQLNYQNIMKKFFPLFIAFLSLTTNVNSQQQTTNEALQSCMNRVTVQGAVAGAIVGGILGALLGNKDNRGQSAAIGAGVGGAAGGAIGWQSSWKTCTEEVNVVTYTNSQSANYQSTAARYGYTGSGTVFKLEALDITPQVKAGSDMNSSFRVAILKPDPTQTPELKVMRSWQCGNTVIPVKPEIFNVAQGTFTQFGKVSIPSANSDIGVQQCQMLIKLESDGQTQQVVRPFTIIPT